MDTTPLWLAKSVPAFPKLNRDLQVDVLVVGAGITGLTAAYLLKRAGVSVAVVDRGSVGQGETGHTTAHLTYATDLRLRKLVNDFGRDHAQAAWDAGQHAMDEICEFASRENIDCGFERVPGYLFAANGKDIEREGEELHREAHLAAELGFDADFVEQAPIVGRPAMVFEKQAQFHPIRYLRGLAKVIDGGGSHIFEKSEASEFNDSPNRAKVNGHTVRFDKCVIATHVPLQGRSSVMSAMLRQTKLASYSTYAIGGKVAKGRYPHALFWDTADPYLYVRIFAGEDGDYVIVGGYDHKTGQGNPAESYAQLHRAALETFPGLSMDRHWSGQVIETADGLPMIGETGPNEFVATGFAGNGMTFGTLSGIMARDWATGLVNPWRDLFDVHRKRLSAVWDYLRENKDYPFYLAKGRLEGPETDRLSDVLPGEGRIVRGKEQKNAVYRDEKGKLSICSAVCPHMGCIVEWNGAEKTWDCPCHGSRFMTTGEVIAGPAEAPLKAIARPQRETKKSKAGMSSLKQKSAARANIEKAASAAKKKKTIARLPKATRTALAKEGAKAARKRKH